MTDDLLEAWRARARAAGEWRSGEDPEPVLEALAMSTALGLTGALADAPRQEREALRKVGQRALLQVGGGALDDEDLEALRMCASLAREGLRALGGLREGARRVAPSAADIPNPRALVPAPELTRLLRGELDGFAAASLALKVRRSPRALAELSLLLEVAGERRASEDGAALDARPRLALAAASATPVLDPAAGQVVGTLPSVGAEAVLFEASGDEPRRLAVYAEEPDPLRLLADELTTVDVREGYWVGRIAEGVDRLEATLEIGERTEPWALELPQGRGS